MNVIPLHVRPRITHPKVNVAIPTHESCPASFMYAAMNLAAYSVSQFPPAPAEFGTTMVKGTYVHQARQKLLKQALESDRTHILWLDSDMMFPRDALMRLLAHNVDVVGINYCHRGLPFEFVAIKKIGWGENEEAVKLITAPDSKGLETVEAIGFGLVLMRLDAIRACLPDLKTTPWFGFDWVTGEKQVGEDVRFCKYLTDGGLKIHVDHELSNECKHVGQYEYECRTAFDVAEAERQMALAASGD